MCVEIESMEGLNAREGLVYSNLFPFKSIDSSNDKSFRRKGEKGRGYARQFPPSSILMDFMGIKTSRFYRALSLEINIVPPLATPR